jgi:hypothetical protein
MNYRGTRFHSDDWVYVRYARFTKSDDLLAPIDIAASNGEIVRGYQCHEWIDAHPNAAGTARCLDLANREVVVSLDEFDRSRPVQAYAYTSEKVFYLRSNLVESFPDTADAILRANLENVPAPTSAFLRAKSQTVDAIVADIQESENPRVRNALGALPAESLRALVAALFAFDNARAMLDITTVFPPAQVYTNPMEPVRLSTVFLLKRDPTDRVVLRTLALDEFMEHLLIGQTPDGKREIAYNAYRAVDDQRELQAVEAIARQARTSGATLYEAFGRAEDLPVSLHEEFTLFHQLYDATLAYECNTVLQRDPYVKSKKEAVRLTLEVILRGVENRSRDFCLTLDDYRSHIPG